MTRIIELLKQKNHYLDKFYSINEKELLNFREKKFDNLESFYKVREKILEVISYLDQELDKLSKKVNAPLDDKNKRIVKDILNIKDNYVNKILSQDLEILSCIEKEKSRIIIDLQEIKSTKNVVSKYKTKNFLNKLNEKV